MLISGQCSLHLGRMEHGNAGNAYVIIGLLEGISKLGEKWKIFSTIQISSELAEKYDVTVLPLWIYDQHLSSERPEDDFDIQRFVADFDLVLDLSGDLMGPNADLIYPGRRILGDTIASKISQAQTYHFALGVSPGPFESGIDAIASVGSFDHVFVREPNSYKKMLELTPDGRLSYGPCPSLLYPGFQKNQEVQDTNLLGVAPSIWNIDENGSHEEILEQVSHLIEVLMSRNSNMEIVYFSHSNSFDPVLLDRGELVLGVGNDWVQTKTLREELQFRFPGKELGPMRHENLAKEIASLGGLITGRVHGTIASHSQGVPAWMLEYRKGPRPLKNKGFMDMFGATDRLLRPETSKEEIEDSAVFDLNAERERLIQRYNDLRTESLDTIRKAISYFGAT